MKTRIRILLLITCLALTASFVSAEEKTGSTAASTSRGPKVIKRTESPHVSTNTDSEASSAENDLLSKARKITEANEQDTSAVAQGDAAAPEADSDDSHRYEAGKYHTGMDLPENEYYFFATGDKGTLSVYSDMNYRLLREEYPFEGSLIALITKGDYVILTDCYAVPINEADPSGIDFLSPGMFKAGLHFPAGSYTFVRDGEETAAYTVYDALPPHERINREGTFNESITLSLKEGQYLKVTGGHFREAPAPVEQTYNDADTVRSVQEKLNAIGYSCGNADGKIGPNTQNAIRSYQTAQGLPATGTINNQLLFYLEDSYQEYLEKQKEERSALTKADFLARYNEAVRFLNESQGASLAEIDEKTLESEAFSPNGNSSFVMDYNSAGDVRSCFLQNPAKAFDHNTILETALASYAIDQSMATPEDALNLALKLVFHGTQDTEKIHYSIVVIEDVNTVWMDAVYPAAQ